MSNGHHVIFVPGLNDRSKVYDVLIKIWCIYGVVPHVYRMGWYDREKSFKASLKGLVALSNKLLGGGNTVSLVGVSAGASAVLNAFTEQPKINAVVNLCGRVRKGENISPSLETASRKSSSFKESVLIFEDREPKMTFAQRKKVLNLIPIWDEIVPKATVPIKGAVNRTFPSVEHVLSGFLSMTLFSPLIMKFIKDRENPK